VTSSLFACTGADALRFVTFHVHAQGMRIRLDRPASHEPAVLDRLVPHGLDDRITGVPSLHCPSGDR
jgi:hypothetical protein